MVEKVVGAVLRKEGRVLLCLRSRGRQYYPGVWDVLGGHVDAHEALAWRSTTAVILLLSFHSASAMIGEDAYVALERDARGVGELLPEAKRLPR